ncbi:MAG: hypothetical protein ACPW60_11220 [Methylohalobius sp. ZOD2]
MMIRKTSCLLMALVLFQGCAGLGSKSVEGRVAQRAQARWDSLVEGDLKTAYEYLSPGYRQAKSFERYQRGILGVGIWQGAKVDKVVCERPEVCKVTVQVSSRLVVPRVGTPMESTSPVYERWILEDGQWWHVPNQ